MIHLLSCLWFCSGIDILNDFITEYQRISAIRSRVPQKTSSNSPKQLINLPHHLQVQLLLQKSLHRLNKRSKVRQSRSLSNQLHRILRLARLDFLHLGHILFLVFLHTCRAEDIIHDNSDDRGEAIVQISWLVERDDRHKNGVHGVRQNVELGTTVQRATEFLEDETEAGRTEENTDICKCLAGHVSSFLSLGTENLTDIGEDWWETLGHLVVWEELEEADDDDCDWSTEGDGCLILVVKVIDEWWEDVAGQVVVKLLLFWQGLGQSGEWLLLCKLINLHATFLLLLVPILKLPHS